MHQPHRLTLPLLLGLAAGGAAAQAGMDVWGEEKNRFGFNLRALFNVKAGFENLGGAPAQTDIGPATGGVDHVYDDGYNRVDSSGNQGGMTWYWGYDRNNQVVEDGISMSSASALAVGSLDKQTDDPHWGGEITYQRELGWSNNYWYGMVFGLGWNRLQFTRDASFTYDAQLTTDAYALQGDAPPAPYRGAFDSGDTWLLGETPTRSNSVMPGRASTTGAYDYTADAYTLRAGLLFETPFTDWLDLQFGGGAVGTMVQGKFKVSETTLVADLAPYSVSVEDSSTGFAGGGYGEIDVSLRISRGIYAFAGAQYMFLTEVSQSAAGREITLDFASSVSASVGMNFAF